MSRYARVEAIGAAVVLIACAAFVASFAFGLRAGGRAETRMPDRTGTVADPALRSGRVEVLNASGRGGVARATTLRLREAGYDVVFFGNASAALGDSTIVISRVADDAVARAVARSLEIARVTTLRDSALFLDATVVLGRDWQAGVEAHTDARESWTRRLRRWLAPGR
jgi:hypothetical protein